MQETSGPGHSVSVSDGESVSSGIGAQMIIARDLPKDPDGTATTSEIAREGVDDEGKQVVALDAMTVPREVFNRIIYDNNRKARETGHLSQVMKPVLGTAPCDKFVQRFSQMDRVQTISSDDDSSLSPPPTSNYGGSEIQFPPQTPRDEVSSVPSMSYGGSIVAMPPSALPIDPFLTPRASTGIIAQRYIQSEEIISNHAEKEEGIEETRKVYTPIPRKFEISDDSEVSDEAMTEVEWRDKEPYMTPTKKGKKRNKGKGVRRPETPERPILNMLQTPSRRKLEADWVKPAEWLTSEKEPANLEAFISEYLWNTNGLRDFMVGREDYDVKYAAWCGEQAEHVAARKNHTDAVVMSARKISVEIKEQVELSREYDEARAEKLDERLSKIEKKVAKIAPVNMAKVIENAMSACMEKMIDQLTDRVVERFKSMAEESQKKDEIRRGKQVEATPEENCMSDIEFEPGATFSEKENRKVEKVIRAEMEVDEQALEQSKHGLVIPPRGVRGEFPRLEVEQVTILKKKPVVTTVPQQKKKEVKKPEVKEVPKGPKADKKKPDVKKPEEKRKETWAQRAAPPAPSNK